MLFDGQTSRPNQEFKLLCLPMEPALEWTCQQQTGIGEELKEP